MPVEDAVHFLLPVLTGLSAMHEAGIVHRDLKPANVQSTQDRIVVCDFGLATAEDVTRLTMSGMLIGSAAYMSPEQARGSTATPASDVFSAGVILYQMLTKRRPHEASSLASLIHKIATEPPVAITEWRSDLPSGLISALEFMLSKDPGNRPSALEARSLLSEAP